MADLEVMKMKLDYGTIQEIQIYPQGNGWEWKIFVPGRLHASGFCLTLKDAIERVTQMCSPWIKEI